MKFILAEKREMTQKFAEDGKVIPVTKLVITPNVVTQIKTQDHDGYVAVQLGFGTKRNISKPVMGHLKNLGKFKFIKEFRIKESDQPMKTIDDGEGKKETIAMKVGDVLTATVFQPGDKVQATGTSKGRGFQGVVKRHGFSGSPASHGHKDQLRMPGSIGAGGNQHVFKGTRMAGRMGGDQVTVKNLQIIEVDPAGTELFIKGAVPGARGSLILVSGGGEIVMVVPAEKKETAVVEEKKADETATATPVAVELPVVAPTEEPSASAEPAGPAGGASADKNL